MNQTETLIARARNDADRRLIEYGGDPWLIEWFFAMSPLERLTYTERFVTLALRRRRELGLA